MMMIITTLAKRRTSTRTSVACFSVPASFSTLPTDKQAARPAGARGFPGSLTSVVNFSPLEHRTLTETSGMMTVMMRPPSV